MEGLRGGPLELVVHRGLERRHLGTIGRRHRQRRERRRELRHAAALASELLAQTIRERELRARRDGRVDHEARERLLGPALRSLEIGDEQGREDQESDDDAQVTRCDRPAALQCTREAILERETPSAIRP